MSNLVAFSGSVPQNYEQYLGPILFEPYAVDIVSRIKDKKVNQILELAAGTGRVTHHLSTLLSEEGNLIATDLNGAMLQVAQQLVKAKNIQWQVADAQELPFQDNRFELVVCQFGVMFLPDKLKAFKEAHRVLKRGGSFLFNTWDSLQNNNPGNEMVQNALTKVFGSEAPDFMIKGPFSFYDEKEIIQLLKDAGFRDIKIEKLTKMGLGKSVDHFIEGYTKGTPLAAYLNAMNTVKQDKYKETLREMLVTQYGETNLQIPMQALICEGRK